LLAQYRRDDRSIQDLVDGLRDAMRLKGETKIAEHLTDMINDHPRFRLFDVPAQDLLDLGPDFDLYAFYQDITGLKPEVLERIAGAEGVSILEDVFSRKQADILSAANSDPDGAVNVSIELGDVLPVVQRKMEVHVHQYNHVTVDDNIRDENQAIIETVKAMREQGRGAGPSFA
jgi:hypothetical protein